MSRNLKTKEGQKSFLNDYLDDLLFNINETYGPILLEELQKRLECTISKFNEEMNEAFGMLKKRNDERKALYNDYPDQSNENILTNESEWEKKLKEIDNKSN